MPTTTLRQAARTRPSDPDDDLVAELNGPPPLDVCREALEFWTRRHAGLPRHRRGARRDAAAMVARWEERMRDAELAEHAASVWHRLLAVLGVTWPTRSERQARVRRGLLFVGGGIIALGVVLMAIAVASLVIAYEVVAHLG